MAYLVSIAISVICEFARLIILKKTAKLNVSAFLKDVYMNVIIVTTIAGLGCYFAVLPIGNSTFLQFIASLIVCVLISMCSIYIFGLSLNDRAFIKAQIKKIIKTHKL